ncbi:MAG TPA: PHP domain-containing protein [Thermomicrobiales bacterium]|nr:PHP domain-containing protein [Thermomicrobiales bacterium]
MHQTVTLHPNDPVDLHLHSTASDGRWTPDSLIAYLAEHGFKLVALADHDTMHNVPAMLQRATEAGIILIPAVEVTTRWRGRHVHLLVYGVDADAERSAAFMRVLRLQQDQLRTTAERMLELLVSHGRFVPSLNDVSMGFPLTPHRVFTAMIRDGHGGSLFAAHNIIRGMGEPVIVDVPLEDAVAAASEAGAVSIVAHPGRDDGDGFLREAELDSMLEEIPIDGIEAHYRSYKDADTDHYRRWAERRGLLVSSGSDSHWPSHPVNPIPHPARWSADLLRRLGVDVNAWEGPAWLPTPAEAESEESTAASAVS